ncbi:uncharacterized protein LOC131163620 [Malania oleifera]|uniref:uncharacterized protein LOC131163620 n=1 Tax=Malania oleifera TaxID=397392 RepID=UPI0025ADC7AC|nr:uncharacterized protein LOC131163620 [Malania oleifera]XP_057976219.1 uncharacterized protein LOC131163620 [Malania oleifera]
MSPASKSKSKSRQKVSSKPSGAGNTGSGSPASAYNPISGTFHSLDTAPVGSSPTMHNSSRFRNIDDRNENSGSSHGTVTDYDSASNNGSCSGESEDPKEKTTGTVPKQETVPGCDNDKREKIRQKNERKHQRQKERRAQELHERCCGYLMSRKLEALSQQLVAMGFSSERATLALILNEGKLEESVAWLFDVSEEATQSKDTNLGNGSNLKIDVSEELAQIAVMEVKHKCSKQEVEKAIIASEGDLEKAEETLRAQKQEQPPTPPKPQEIPISSNLMRPQEKHIAPVTMQQRMNERDFNPTKAGASMLNPLDPGNRNMQSLKMNQQKLMEKRWPPTASSPSVSYSLASPMQVAPPSAKMEPRYGGIVGNDGRYIPQSSVREPAIMMHRPQPINAMQKHVSTVDASPPETTGWYPSNFPGFEIAKSNGNLPQNQSRVSVSQENLSLQQYYHQACNKQQHFFSGHVDFTVSGLESSWSRMGSSSPSLAVPPSLGLFSGWGSMGTSGSSSPVDWNTGGSMPECDYTSIDWTLEANSSSSKSNGLWLGLSSFLKNNSGASLAGTNGICISELQDGMAMEAPSGTHEWTSPFAGKDIFRVPRQFVTSSL